MKLHPSAIIALITIALCFSLDTTTFGQKSAISLIKPSEVKTWLSAPSDKTKIINFWASWCGPCIREIHQFSQLQSKYQNEVDILLLSLDDPSLAQTKVKGMVKKKNINGNIRVLDTKDMHAFINDINTSWSGAIPATLFLYKDQRTFLEKEFLDGELLTSYINFKKPK